MPVTRLEDKREFQTATVEEADQKFNALAKLIIDIKAKTAVAEKRIATTKAKLESETKIPLLEVVELKEWLTNYINANKDRFVSPKNRKTGFGNYGLRKATKLTIVDKNKVIIYSDQQKLALYETKHKLIKKTIAAVIKNGKKVPGTKIISGNMPGYTVDAKLLDAAIK